MQRHFSVLMSNMKRIGNWSREKGKRNKEITQSPGFDVSAQPNVTNPHSPISGARILILAVAVTLLTFLNACALPRVSAQQRTFLDISLEFLGEYQLPKMKFKDTPIGGISALAYDRKNDKFLALSDDRSNFAPARFYTLKLSLNDTGIKNVEVENVTFLKGKDGKTYPKGTIDPEGIALSPQRTVFISSEGVTSNGIAPFVGEFDLSTGELRQNLPMPERYIADVSGEKQTKGILDNFGFEALTLNPTGSLPASGEPIRLFAVTESALVQDKDPVELDEEGKRKPQTIKCRLLHYLISDGPPLIISEHLYPLSPISEGALYHGLTEFLAIDGGGHFLSLERSLGLLGFNINIYQVFTGAATDTSRIASLKGDLRGLQPVKKKLLLNMKELGIALEGMTLGPRLSDGSQSLILVSDDNFSEEQLTKLLMFRLKSTT